MRAHAHVSESGPEPFTLADLPGRLRIPSLYQHQADAIGAVQDGRDVLIVSPTGSGKFEIIVGAGLLRGGLTLIVAPLRSLIADQYRRLEALKLPVRIWNSDVKDAYKDETLRLIDAGWDGFIITTPESLKGDYLRTAMAGRVNLCAIDEAHCVLKDRGFRLGYAWLGNTVAKIDPVVRMALTATLPDDDRPELVATLGLSDPFKIVLPVARSNLTIRVVEHHKTTIDTILNKHHGEAGIVFCATVAAATKLYEHLGSQGRSVALYHGRLPAKAKASAQAAFMSGDRLVGVCTDAFLLGVDKADLRFVAHYDHPKSIEDWTQGFGRAGRDGKPSIVYGCFSGSKEGQSSRKFLIDSTFPQLADLSDVWEYILSAPFRDETQSAIAEHVLGRRGKYSGGAIITTLQRHQLLRNEIIPEDRRRRRHFACGNFDAVDWNRYLDEYKQTCRRFDQLCELVKLPDDEIPGEIDRYFGSESEGTR